MPISGWLFAPSIRRSIAALLPGPPGAGQADGCGVHDRFRRSINHIFLELPSFSRCAAPVKGVLNLLYIGRAYANPSPLTTCPGVNPALSPHLAGFSFECR